MKNGKIGVAIGCFILGCFLALVFFFTGKSISDIYELQIKKTKYDPYANMYGRKLCQDARFSCVVIDKDTAWDKFRPDARERELIMKLNRLNIPLKKGMTVAIPKDLKKSLMDFSPYPKKTASIGEKFIVFDPALLAWAAYDKDGNLVRWAPGLGGKDYCPDIKRACRTIVGDFAVTMKGHATSRSGAYPIGCGGKGKPCALMPWVMYFYKHLYGIHGSDTMVGYHASHGCVRTFSDEAKWLNQNFVEIGTKVFVKPYPK